ncbi:tyrosine-type recombinase/integrase [Terrilactibacillus laevilacticus]|uniref:tyrosine-type recombinase/integrase n=1 Tax=Terrilactibacillus laevilacticus TaxID=1380157 RepID=UPI001FE73A3F|nr:tyrosine-type recombinase/integrase [Terrilactibacillus laevilacticus]
MLKITLDIIDFAKEQLLNDIIELENTKESSNLNYDRFKFKLAGLLSKYEVKRESSELFESDIEEKISVYLSAKKIEGLSHLTLKDYKLELRLFNNAINKKIREINSNDIRLYLSRFDKLKMSTIGKKLYVLKSFFSWLHSEEIITRNPTSKIKQPKTENLMGKSLTIEEIEMLRESCETLRQRAFIEVLYSTGSRLSEIQQLDIDDIDFQNMSTKVIGKGSKEREVYLSYKAMYHLKKYLDSRNDECDALFVTTRRPFRRMSNRAIEREINIIGKNAKLTKRLYPHLLRHTFATLTLNNGADITAIQALLGHASPDVTLRYTRITEARKREQFQKHFVQ